MEHIYPNRFTHIAELCRMGANITLEGPCATIRGKTPLSGAPVVATDLRAGACLYLAALAAEGESLIQHVHHVDRGYENFNEKLRHIGASVQCENGGEGHAEKEI
jgi:UDP-N-acetylglucosamine 1-carboxyvinyltransferase